jgi:hypothetical protein
MRRKIKVTSFMFLIMLCFACAHATFISNSYKILATAETVYDTSLKTAGEMYKNGQISDEKKDEIIKIATKYRAAYVLAKQAVIEAETVKSEDSLKKAQEAITAFLNLSDELTSFITEVIKNG